MDQGTFSLLGLTFVLIASAGVLAMLELWENQQTRFNKNVLRVIHRTCGYIFITIYVVMMYYMLKRVATQTEPLSAQQTVHVALALMIFPLLAIKILILRRLPGLEEKLPYLGISIFTLAFTLNALTAGFYFVRTLNPRYISLQFFDRSKFSVDVGRGLLEAKCQKCHTLERVFLAVKTETEWEKTVNVMVLRDPSIHDDEAAPAAFRVCQVHPCQDHDRVYAKSEVIGDDKGKWQIIVERMQKNGAPLGDDDIPKIVTLLAMLKTR